MARKQSPGSYAVTLEDVASVIQEHALEWEATAYVVVTLGKPDGPTAYVEITIREGVYAPAGRECARVRYPLDGRHVERWPANILYAVLAAYDQLEHQAWMWPNAKRKAARGE